MDDLPVRAMSAQIRRKIMEEAKARIAADPYGYALQLAKGFVANQSKHMTKAENHRDARWELAEGTTLAFNLFSSVSDDEAQRTVTAKLTRTDDGEISWTWSEDQP